MAKERCQPGTKTAASNVKQRQQVTCYQKHKTAESYSLICATVPALCQQSQPVWSDQAKLTSMLTKPMNETASRLSSMLS